MQHKGTKELRTKRLILRKFMLSDAGDMYRNWASDREVTRFLTWAPHESERATQKIIKEWIDEYKKQDFYQWAIQLKVLGEVIGSISVVRVDEDREEMEIGYCIGKRWWRQGITSEALKRVIEFLFSEVEVKRITAKHDVKNVNSGKVMLKCGLKYERTYNKEGKNSSGEICDLAVYSLSAEDYKK